MWKPIARVAAAATTAVLLVTPALWSQATLQDTALAAATAEALEPGIRAALKDGQPVSFEHRSTDEHRKGASRILLGTPMMNADTAVVEVWFGRCEAAGDAEILKIRIYSFTFEREEQEWSLLGAARLGTNEGSCDGDMKKPQPVQT